VQGKVQPMTGTTPYVRTGDGATMVMMGILLVIGLILSRIRAA
jgi:apolipoprotein N-acyltransferase